MRRRASGPHCPVGLEHWSRFTDQDLPPDECARCEAHLETCAECRARVRAVKDTIGLCRRVARQALPPRVKASARKRIQALLAPVTGTRSTRRTRRRETDQ
ncbi:MAG: zf-HC2 domain-containing protein [Acidobacteria bacterium]|nr:zf-HC2 domain-containing protein [Acidobacteriota bacterium]